MQKLLVMIVLITSFYGYIQSNPVDLLGFSSLAKGGEQILENAFKNKISDLQVEGQGIVIKILSDDVDGSKHQRFIVKLSSGQTLLIAHNIDIAPRINSLKQGDLIRFYGEYEWNAQGGIIHWTHHDPNNNHIGGWIEHDGIKYQ